MYALLAASLAFAGSVAAQGGPPLASQSFQYDTLPYQIDTDPTGRGPQSGYNRCNSTTEGPTSHCQTAIVNSVDDWCLWGPPDPNSEIGATEHEAVAWCTKPGHGTRLIPAGALSGVQFTKTPDYVQVVGFIDQRLINIAADDYGGEMDGHGADQRGNPLGGVVFSNAWTGSYVHAPEWHNFMGANVFCIKVCDPAGPSAADYCEHIFDRIGCHYNAPAAYVDGVFESCLGDSQDFPGIYTGADGQVTTYQQPPESLGPITTVPYTPKIPASSSCTPYQSAQLFSALPSPSIQPSSSGASSITSSPVSTRPASTAGSGNVSRSSAATTSAAGNGAVSLGPGAGGVWTAAIGVVGALVGALVAL